MINVGIVIVTGKNILYYSMAFNMQSIKQIKCPNNFPTHLESSFKAFQGKIFLSNHSDRSGFGSDSVHSHTLELYICVSGHWYTTVLSTTLTWPEHAVNEEKLKMLNVVVCLITRDLPWSRMSLCTTFFLQNSWQSQQWFSYLDWEHQPQKDYW